MAATTRCPVAFQAWSGSSQKKQCRPSGAAIRKCACPDSPRELHQLFGVAQRFRRDRSPESMRPISRVRASEASVPRSSRGRAAFHGVLFDEIMMIGETGDLRQVRHADHLAGRESFFNRRPTASAALPPTPASISSKTSVGRLVWLVRGGRAGFERQSDARQFPARGDLFERLRLLARDWAKSESRPRRRPCRTRRAGCTRISTRVFSMASEASSASTRFASRRAPSAS